MRVYRAVFEGGCQVRLVRRDEDGLRKRVKERGTERERKKRGEKDREAGGENECLEVREREKDK